MEFRLTGIRDDVESILPRVSKPARYTGGEMGEIRKDHDDVEVLFALAFPDVYEVGMSNLGLKLLYATLNRRDDTAAERVFAPASDMETVLRAESLRLYALESFVPLKDFNIVGFSLSYELTYTNVLNMLDLAGIPLRSVDRDDSHPIIVAGGHCTVNPEPMREFMDAFVVGDGEEVVHGIVDVYKRERGSRANILNALAQVQGVYVPSIERVDSVKRAVVLDFENVDYPKSFVVPFIETIHDRAAIEIMRGCTRGCRFCQAGMITRPVRERSAAKLEEQAEAAISSTGYEDIGLMSLSSADYTDIETLVGDLISRHRPDRVGVSLPSIRADADCVRFAAMIQSVRKSGLTFAPEAGTQRLRDAINKNVTEPDLLDAVDVAIGAGWRKVKLYFMIGLPTETDEDVLAIGDLVDKVAQLARSRGKQLSINVGVSSFVPKPHTPFQWRAQDSKEELDRKIWILKDRVRGRNISLSWHDTDMSELEAIMARGGKELGPAIQRAWELGAKFDGWDDQFDGAKWLQAFRETGVDTDRIAHRPMASDEPLPWDHIDCGVSKRWLSVQDKLAEKAKTVDDCRFGTCLNCGVKESGVVSCELRVGKTTPTLVEPERAEAIPAEERLRVWYRLSYEKSRGLRWLSHLDLVRTFERAIRRSRIPVAYSEGFNPRPRMSFYSQLGVGMTGEAEPMTIELRERMEPRDVLSVLNSGLPEGMRVRSAQEVDGRRSPELHGSEYLLGVDGACDLDLGKAAGELMASDAVVIDRRKEKEFRKLDIRPAIEAIEVLHGVDNGQCTGLIRTRVGNVRPSEIVDALKRTAPDLELKFAHRIKVY